jgi:hypothetical protein
MDFTVSATTFARMGHAGQQRLVQTPIIRRPETLITQPDEHSLGNIPWETFPAPGYTRSSGRRAVYISKCNHDRATIPSSSYIFCTNVKQTDTASNLCWRPVVGVT